MPAKPFWTGVALTILMVGLPIGTLLTVAAVLRP